MPDWYSEFQESSGPEGFAQRYLIQEGGGSRILEDRDIVEKFNWFLEQERLRPFLERVRIGRRQVEQVIHRGRVGRWLSGQESPSEPSIQRVAAVLGLPAQELPRSDPSNEETVIAQIKAITFIRECRFPPLPLPISRLDVASYAVLEFAALSVPMIPKCPSRDRAIAEIVRDVADQFSGSPIRRGEDLEHLLADWLAPHVRFSDALTSEEPTSGDDNELR